MAEVIKFKIETIEDTFIKSLSEEQNEMFYEIITKIQDDYEKLQSKYVKKIAECEMLKIEIETLKGGSNET